MPCTVIIVGLGPGDSQHWTAAASKLLDGADELYVRTAHHPSASELRGQIHTFDPIYEAADDFEQANDRVAAALVRLGQREGGVVYAVPGHPRLDEPTVPRICELAAAEGGTVKIVPGLSLLEATLAALNLDGYHQLQLVKAGELVSLHHPPLAPDRPALITGLTGRAMAAGLRQVLLNAYPENIEVVMVQAAGTDSERRWTCLLSGLERQPGLDVVTALYLPADPANASLTTFQETVAHLRAPAGCPWDRKQTHHSLRPYLLEETYEVLETLDANDTEGLAEELGDLLLQIALHVQIATESGEFKMGAVIDHINRKLLRRHPHVFGDVQVNSVNEVVVNWDAIKKAEKRSRNSHRDSTAPDESGESYLSALDGVPVALPALAQALAISKRAVRVGFEWPNIEGVLDKLIEEAREITEATDLAHLETEIGDLLFSAVNLARWRNIDAESALRATNARFTRRFQKLETLATAQGKSLSEMSIEEMDNLWNEAKQLAE